MSLSLANGSSGLPELSSPFSLSLTGVVTSLPGEQGHHEGREGASGLEFGILPNLVYIFSNCSTTHATRNSLHCEHLYITETDSVAGGITSQILTLWQDVLHHRDCLRGKRYPLSGATTSPIHHNFFHLPKLELYYHFTLPYSPIPAPGNSLQSFFLGT